MKKSLTFRIRTIILTIVLIASLVFYFLVSTFFRETLNWIDFIMLASVQIITHFLYYPDGELNGANDETYVSNKKAYNDKANNVNQNRHVKLLDEYTKVDFITRQRTYIETQMGHIGLDYNDYVYLKEHVDLINLKAKTLEVNGRLIALRHYNKKVLKNLLYKKLPVEINSVNTIMSANENVVEQKIKDKSKVYTFVMHAKKILFATVIGAFLAYIGYTKKENFGLEDFVMMAIDLTSIVATAVLSYSSGERATKVYKCEFYIDLSLFLDTFAEWLMRDKQIDVNKPYENTVDKKEDIDYNNSVDTTSTLL